jgi:hypothetical protein
MASCPACQGQQRSFRGYVATSQDPGGITPPPAAPRSGHNAARHGAFWYSISAGRRAPGHHPMAASMGWSEPMLQPAATTDTNRTQPVAWRDQDDEEPADRDTRHTPVRRAVPAS